MLRKNGIPTVKHPGNPHQEPRVDKKIDEVGKFLAYSGCTDKSDHYLPKCGWPDLIPDRNLVEKSSALLAEWLY